MEDLNLKILYEDNHILVVLKPINIPVQEDESKDLDLLTILKKYPKGSVEAGEIGLPIEKDNLILPCGIYGRFES